MKRVIINIINWIRRNCEIANKIYYAYRALWYWLNYRGNPVKCKLGKYNLIFETNPRDKGLSRELVAEKVHEPLTTGVLAEMIKPGWVVVDLGSHIGYFALLEACLVGTSGKVIAIEPAPENYNVLVRNIKINDLTNTVVTHNLAISGKKEKRDFFISKLSNQSSFYPTHKYENIITVEADPLDEILQNEKRIDAIRMDIEGGEYEVIYGMIETIKRYHPLLLIELHPSSKRKSFLNELNTLGYECLSTIDRAKNTSLFRGIMADTRDILNQSIVDILQAEDSEYVYLVVLIHQSQQIKQSKQCFPESFQLVVRNLNRLLQIL